MSKIVQAFWWQLMPEQSFRGGNSASRGWGHHCRKAQVAVDDVVLFANHTNRKFLAVALAFSAGDVI
jgi:hypothetical protein